MYLLMCKFIIKSETKLTAVARGYCCYGYLWRMKLLLVNVFWQKIRS